MESLLCRCCLAALICLIPLLASDNRAIAERAASLCLATERTILSCTLKRPVKLMALCSSSQLTKESGYVQYRFGLPGKIELEFPKQREASSQSFRYHHYFRAQVDLTEISFTNEGVEYTVFDNYNGEEKPAISEQGVTVVRAGATKDATMVCNGRAKVNFENLDRVLPSIE